MREAYAVNGERVDGIMIIRQKEKDMHQYIFVLERDLAILRQHEYITDRNTKDNLA